MSLVSHLEEFRKRLVACIICFFAAVLICLGQAAWLTERLMEKAQGFQFVYIAPTELVLSYVRLALTGGVSLACPVMLYQIWGFIRPGLTRRERQSCFVILTFGMLLFFAGMNAGQTISPMVSIESYISFVSTTLVTFGIVFELPVVVIMFTRIGLLNPAMLRKNRKYVILAVFVLAAFITPPDVTSQILVAFPMLFLFEISLLLSRILFRKRLKREMQVNGQEAGDV